MDLKTLDRPISKKELAEAVGISYQELLYQLNKQLKYFWEVKGERKKRGAHEEFIAPSNPNTVYVMLGEGGTIYALDPLVNIFGKMGDGTRCDECPVIEKEKCLEKIKNDVCFNFTAEERRRQEKLFAANKRSGAPPMDHIIGCVALKILEGEDCSIEVCETECNFLRKIKVGTSRI
ncbi:MAG: hypothetical protein ACUVTL_08385 [Thermoproteota archaeon]